LSLIIGTSGWWYDEWVGPFYDRKKGMFTRYAGVFNTTEINSTFYRYPTARMVRGWYRTAPAGFVFAVKLPRVITHEKWLRLEEGVEGDTERFLDLIRPMAEKLGPILIQLRPKFNYDDHAENLERYLEILPGNYEWAVEFRHRSWMRPETQDMLRRHGVAYTIVDEPLLPPEVQVSADFAYIRWHGRGSRPWYNYDYKPEELEEWVPRVRETVWKAKRVYGYFNNHFGANAVKNAVEMLTLLGSATPRQAEALRRIVEHRRQATRPRGVQPLDAFVEEEEGLSVADLLMRFTTASRLGRAEKIGDRELTITRNTGGRIEAAIRDYSIEVDLVSRSLRHDCDDWRKGLEAKRMCKHMAKLFLSLPESQAKEVLAGIWEDKERWKFEYA
jgi:uncharacterized protein YecE (DUF72 family)